jgi:membrane protein implicated in regulation of membrane protease activity
MGMSPAYKYTLGRFVLFFAVLALLFPLPLNILIKAMIALVISAVLSLFLLRRWRNEMAEHIGSAVSRRQQEKARLRAALAGDEEAAAAGDRAAEK